MKIEHIGKEDEVKKMNEKEKYIEICKHPFTPEFEQMIKDKVIPHINKEHWEILMNQASEICSERTGWNNCDNILMLTEQLKVELKVLIEFNKLWRS
jgi:hypothetical protein